jgi:hypothetical protein
VSAELRAVEATQPDCADKSPSGVGVHPEPAVSPRVPQCSGSVAAGRGWLIKEARIKPSSWWRRNQTVQRILNKRDPGPSGRKMMLDMPAYVTSSNRQGAAFAFAG